MCGWRHEIVSSLGFQDHHVSAEKSFSQSGVAAISSTQNEEPPILQQQNINASNASHAGTVRSAHLINVSCTARENLYWGFCIFAFGVHAYFIYVSFLLWCR